MQKGESANKNDSTEDECQRIWYGAKREDPCIVEDDENDMNALFEHYRRGYRQSLLRETKHFTTQNIVELTDTKAEKVLDWNE